MKAERLGNILLGLSRTPQADGAKGEVWAKVMGDKVVLHMGETPIATIRATAPTGTELTSGNLSLNILKREVTCNGQQVQLTLMQYGALRFLLENAHRVVHREELVRAAFRSSSNPNVADIHFCYIRRKLIAAGWDGKILTVRGVGFRIAS